MYTCEQRKFTYYARNNNICPRLSVIAHDNLMQIVLNVVLRLNEWSDRIVYVLFFAQLKLTRGRGRPRLAAAVWQPAAAARPTANEKPLVLIRGGA